MAALKDMRTLLVLCTLICACYGQFTKRPSLAAYTSQRDSFFAKENAMSFGSDVTLNAQELKANEIIMEMKRDEYTEGMAAPHLFSPTRHFFDVIEKIGKAPLFKLLTQMPKGGVLHAHDTALASTDVLINITYRNNLWACQGVGENFVVSFKFSKTEPDALDGCKWEKMSKVRELFGAATIDEFLRNRFTMAPTRKFLDNNAAWQRFFGIFGLLDGLLFFAPVWADYYYSALGEFYADGVQYLEFRSTLPVLYDLEGTKYTELDTVRIYKETLDKFMAANPGFIGSKLIYAPLRIFDQTVVAGFVKTCAEIKRKYPSFVAGFDLVGQEELGRSLKEFLPQLLSMPSDIDFYFHAGETNWFGTSVDENLIDAVLLGTKRIGHGFALVKHPLVLRSLKERNIAVEINPISNQVLQLVSDYRNHPCSQLFADNYPVVISSDDPSFWKSTPLSHDFYVAFLGLASAHADLRLLKKLVTNSITYSALSEQEKVVAFGKLQKRWDIFINSLVNTASGNLLSGPVVVAPGIVPAILTPPQTGGFSFSSL